MGMEYTRVARRKEETMNRTRRIARTLAPLALISAVAVTAHVAQAAPSSRYQVGHVAASPVSNRPPLPCFCNPFNPVLCCLSSK
jgi:hypothetical protein